MPHPLLIFSKSEYLIQVVDTNSNTEWQTVRSRSVGFFRSQLIWIYTVCKGRTYPGSAGQGLMSTNNNFFMKKKKKKIPRIIISYSSLTITTLSLWANSADNKFFIYFSRNQDLIFHANWLHWTTKIRKIFQYVACWIFYLECKL